MDSGDVRTSKRLSLVLRHRPETVGIALDPHGWVDVDRLLEAFAQAEWPLSRQCHRRDGAEGLAEQDG